VLQRAGIVSATNCSKLQVAETSLYAHPYAHLSPPQATVAPWVRTMRRMTAAGNTLVGVKSVLPAPAQSGAK